MVFHNEKLIHFGIQVCIGLIHLLLLFVCTNLAIFFSSNLVVDQFQANMRTVIDILCYSASSMVNRNYNFELRNFHKKYTKRRVGAE